MSTHFSPATGQPQEWSEALARVDDFLRAHRLADRLRRSELAMELLREAADRHAAQAKESPVTLAMRVAQERLDQWFAARVGQTQAPPERLSALGRVAFLACDGPRHAGALLQSSGLHPGLEQRMRQWSGRAGPNLEVSRMAPRDIDLGLVPEVAEGTWEGLERRPYIRLLLVWFLFGLVLGVLFYLTHTITQ